MVGQPAQQRTAGKLSICFRDVRLAFRRDDGRESLSESRMQQQSKHVAFRLFVLARLSVSLGHNTKDPAICSFSSPVGPASSVTAVSGHRGGMREASAKVAVADSHYGNTANLIALAQRKIRAHVADLRSKMRNPRSAGIYPPERFAYQSKADCYKCPAGQILYRHHFLPSRGYYESRPTAAS